MSLEFEIYLAGLPKEEREAAEKRGKELIEEEKTRFAGNVAGYAEIAVESLAKGWEIVFGKEMTAHQQIKMGKILIEFCYRELSHER